MIKAALIDMDGILYDSMPFHAKSWKKLSDELGMNIPEEEFYLYEGMTGDATINLLSQRELNKKFTPGQCKEIYLTKTRYFKELGFPPVMPGAKETLQLLKSRNIRCVLVTGSGQLSLLERLNRDFPDIFSPECMVTSHNVTKGKPDPEPYLKGADLAKVRPEDCIAIDNAPLGVRSAALSGAFTIGVTTGPIPEEKLKKEGADIVVASMKKCYEFLNDNIERL